MSNVPPGTMNLLIINIALWLVCSFAGSFGDTIYAYLGLHYWGAEGFNPMQFVTYMFLQAPLGSSAGITHILFNMFALYMFGRILELTWGTKRFLLFYFVTGVGAALIQELTWMATLDHDFYSMWGAQNGVTAEEMKAFAGAHTALAIESMNNYMSSLLTIGASGAVFGLLLGFGVVYPNAPMYLFFIPVPIKAKWLVLGYAALEFFFGVSGAVSSVAHFAHLGGMLFALPLLWYWHKKGTLHGRRY